ncbi:hypothetical protein GCM10027258_92760 [Amycolatopsis stemonae]
MSTPKPPAGLDHCHRVSVVLDLECGHRRVYLMPLDSVAAHPLYARPGTRWRCQGCAATLPGIRHVVATRYDYACAPCEAAPLALPAAATPNPPRPQLYQPEHEHGPHDTAGHAIVRAIPTRYRLPSSVQDITWIQQATWISGPHHFGRAVAAVRQLNNAEPDAGPHVIVPVHTDGCRRDHW